MNKFIRMINRYLVIGLPFVLLTVIWESFYSEEYILQHAGVVTTVIWHALAYNLMLWFIMLTAFLVMLVTLPSVRQKILASLASIKERDEREEYITGKAAKSTFLATLSLMIVLLFLSMFSVKVETLPAPDPLNKGSTTSLSIGASLNFIDGDKVSRQAANGVVFNSRDYQLSASAMIMMLMAWQLLTFHIAARRE